MYGKYMLTGLERCIDVHFAIIDFDDYWFRKLLNAMPFILKVVLSYFEVDINLVSGDRFSYGWMYAMYNAMTYRLF